MIDMWNKRYKDTEYAYGITPNEFFKTTLEKYYLKGNILLPAEGEGRNAVFAATQGIDTHAFDISTEGKRKAMLLANSNDVNIHYTVGDFLEMDYTNSSFDTAVLIFSHFPPHIRSLYHKKISDLIKPDGLLIFEGFSTNNLPLRVANPKIGGPDKLEMLCSIDMIKEDFTDFEVLELQEETVNLSEGAFHNGRAKVIRFIGKKKG